MKTVENEINRVLEKDRDCKSWNEGANEKRGQMKKFANETLMKECGMIPSMKTQPC